MLDLTIGVAAEVLLRAAQEAAAGLDIGILVVDVLEPERIVYASEGAATICGRPRAELEGSAPWAFLAPEVVAQELERFALRGRGAAPTITFESVFLRPDGTRVPVELAITTIVTTDATLSIVFVRDLTTRQAATETLRRSEARFRSVVEGAPDGVVILERGRITFMNELAAELLGVDRIASLGTLITDHLPSEDAAVAGERIGRMVATGATFDPMEYRPKDNLDRVVEIKSIVIDRDGEPLVLAFARDISARKRIERELLRADRLASVGMLSSAVAHEINNPLTYVQLCLQYLERELRSLTTKPRIVEQLQNAREGVERVATILRDLRSFARTDGDEIASIDVIACIERAIKLSDNEIRHRARLVRDFQVVSPVRGNASRLEQVIVNLLVNAAQALPDGDPAHDEIRVAVLTRGDEVEISIRDTGDGIPAQLRERVFEPFFTTKAVGEGTGLGLSVCRSIVEQLGGRIELDSAQPRGAVVRVVLPASHDEATASTLPIAAEIKRARRLRVLVVDDEPLIRRVLAVVLSDHEVALAEHGRTALALLEGGPAFDVVVCDLMMPEMNGMELYEHVAARDPALARRFVFITGGALGPRLATFLDEVHAPTLHKPFEVNQVLDEIVAAADR